MNELWLSVMNIVSNGSDDDWCNLGSSAEVKLIASRREIVCCQTTVRYSGLAELMTCSGLRTAKVDGDIPKTPETVCNVCM